MDQTSARVQPERTRPARSRDTDFFWNGLKEHKLLLQKCGTCGEIRHPPTPVCPACRSLEIEYVESAGRGTVYTYTVHHYPPVPGFTAPFVVVVVDLGEGVRLVANLESPVDQVRIGQPVVVDYEDQPGGWTVPVFRPELAQHSSGLM